MTPRNRSLVVGGLLTTAGLTVVLLAVAIVVPASVNLPDSGLGALPAVIVSAVGIFLMYVGGLKLWRSSK